MSDGQTSWLEAGPAEQKRPKAINVKLLRGMRQFDSKQAALAWANRNAPLRPAWVWSLTAHPRAARTELGTYVLVYDGLMALKGKGIPGRAVLTSTGTLVAKSW